jgi:phage N-6-adenine-methyltransferase
MNNKTRNIMFSSQTDNWGTPTEFFNKLNKMYGPFTLDAAAEENNAKVSKFYTKQNNGLLQEWKNENVFINPPYGRNITGLWVKKAWEECNKDYDTTVTMLLPCRTDTKWFHEYVMNAREVLFVKGRIKFEGALQGAPFPSVVVYFTNSIYYALTSFGVIEK